MAAIDDSSVIRIYEENLKRANVAIIYDSEHFSHLVGYEESLLYAIANCQDKFYRNFQIKKKNGSSRTISEPLPTLKEIQAWLLDNVFAKVATSKAARAYKKRNSIRGHALIHSRRNYVLRVDVANFFGSILIDKIIQHLVKFGYTEQIAVLIANLCCLDGRLPQGAPTSPAISNIYMHDFDEYMLKECKMKSFRYSRYADDITISGNNTPLYMIGHVENRLSELGLMLNKSKTALMGRGSRQIVTGLVVNERVSVPRWYRRKFLQQIYYIKKFGIDGHMQKTGNLKQNYIKYMIGVGNHIININNNDIEVQRALEYLTFIDTVYV